MIAHWTPHSRKELERKEEVPACASGGGKAGLATTGSER
jgi:hypothetical protein